MLSEESYDFIIVGAGAAGCLLASRLAKGFPQQSILLIDAGGPNVDPNYQTFGERHWTHATAPGYNWGYKTVPQEHLEERKLDYSRGKGLGGSTSINFCVYTRGPKADYDRWAQLVEDDTWSWDYVLERFKKLETFVPILENYKPYLDVSAAVHGFDGPLKIGLPNAWERGFGEYLDIVTAKYPINLDHNSGDLLGMSVSQMSASNGHRITASGAFLSSAPANLTIITDAAVERVLFEGQKAVGVEVPGKKIYVRQEVILSAGALDSPKILLLSGIGPREELAQHNIPSIQDIPGIGKKLHDHYWLKLVTTQKPGTHHRTSYISSPETLEEARAQWIKDKTGPLTDYYLPQMMSYLKSDRILCSKEFLELDSAVQNYLQAETTPHYELISHIPAFTVKAPEKYLATAVAFMNGQSAGEVKLRSADPNDPPLVDPNFLSHPFDCRVAVESIREALEFISLPGLAKDQVRLATGPTGQSDEEILKYVRSTGISMWHMCGTVKMGNPAEPDRCVDKDFRVVGIQGLRVVDMSVAPLMPNAHTQAVAYLIGAIAAEKIITQYSEP
ncbi:hypothetical protein MMC28_005919 [Mycoblastus sanguinarius]|nr:hypothetical protein [Mycoblastus sanguinarius]